MSHIFDALQNSEGERPGIDSLETSDATELLRRAERRAASKWEVAGLLQKRSIAGESAERSESFELQTAAPDAMLQENPAAEEVSSGDSGLEVFRQFQSLPVVLTSQSRLVCFDEYSPAAEAIRLLGVRMRHLRRDRPLKKVLITSTIPQEGKSLVAANLACTLALTTQQKVLLLEGDLRRPSLSTVFGLGRNPGICEYLQGECTLAKCIYLLESANVWILPAGSAQSNALELLQSRRLSALMGQLTAWFDWIIVDSPPVLPLADTSIWARLSDGILFVTRQGTTEKRHLKKGLEALEQKKLIGALLNCSSSSAHNKYYYRATNVSGQGDGTTQ